MLHMLHVATYFAATLLGLPAALAQTTQTAGALCKSDGIEEHGLENTCNVSFLQARMQLQKSGTHAHHSSAKKVLPSMVLFTWIFGEEYASKPLFKAFLASAAGCGVDVVVLGDAWPASVARPGNVRHVNLSWQSLISLLEDKIMGGERLHAMRDAARSHNYKKVIDFKPMTNYLFPDLMKGYDWWGWMDNDLMLGDLSTTLLPRLQQSNTDVWNEQVQKPSKSNFARSYGVCYSHGPFTVLRTASAASSLLTREPYREIARLVPRESSIVSFDENGWIVKNYTRSFSGILLSASKTSEIVMSKLIPEVLDVNDQRCLDDDASSALDCSFCRFHAQPAAGHDAISVLDYSKIGRSVLQNKDGSDIVFCHMQKGKRIPNFDDVLTMNLNAFELTFPLLTGFGASG
eukprot:TRINITY_DN15741_c0_g1_i1.p1 TRINITY_DN15741_c0_g1~~TRINITY_DN15741_c0_g1_i1.p1  ORF type:complete len:404 (+),score=75.21 TRINITY_DN15741_c0_g1_i1:57-1268(+)